MMAARVRLLAAPMLHLLLLLSAPSIEASTVHIRDLRFSDPIPGREFFESCNISTDLSEFCNPIHNLGVRHVYVSCGNRELVTERRIIISHCIFSMFSCDSDLDYYCLTKNVNVCI